MATSNEETPKTALEELGNDDGETPETMRQKSTGGDSTGREKTVSEELGNNEDLDGGGLSGIPDVQDIQNPWPSEPGAGNIF